MPYAPGSLLRSQVPIKTFADWQDARPGFLEIDLVAHCGSTSAGPFLFTLSTVDVATGWTLCRGVRTRGEDAVFAELAEVRRHVPFPLLGLDADNGGEFINRTLVHHCHDEAITLTRGRPYRKNASCHVEQIPLCQCSVTPGIAGKLVPWSARTSVPSSERG